MTCGLDCPHPKRSVMTQTNLDGCKCGRWSCWSQNVPKSFRDGMISTTGPGKLRNNGTTGTSKRRRQTCCWGSFMNVSTILHRYLRSLIFSLTLLFRQSRPSSSLATIPSRLWRIGAPQFKDGNAETPRLLSYSSTDFHLGPFFAVCRGSSFDSLSSVDDQESTAYLERSFANTLHAKFNMQRRTRQLSATGCAPTVPACLCNGAGVISSRGNVNGIDVPSVPSYSESVPSSPLFEGKTTAVERGRDLAMIHFFPSDCLESWSHCHGVRLG
ncbi:hypothetical protein BR93DRAFT_559854 [Coniochaeta sp. PMI_546]|nr:hypothetical protein BR93DRAFT_559854 [Coniochaeta sp. PMI_546]